MNDLDRCREVEYTWGPAGRKGSKKCATCEWYVVPDAVRYPFYDIDAVLTKGTVYLEGREWYKQTGCCPNCEPGNSTVPYGWRRNLGRRSRKGGWCKDCGDANEWFPVENQYSRMHEARGQNRRQMPTQPSGQISQMRTRMLKKGTNLARKLGRTPSHAEFWSSGLHQRCVKQIFGSTRNLVIELDLQPRRQGQCINRRQVQVTQRYCDKELRELLRETMLRKGRALSKQEWDEEIGRPCAKTIAQRLGNGSWRRACALVGFEPNAYREFSREAIEKGWIVRGLNPNEIGKHAYEILKNPTSEYNQQCHEIERKTKHYTQEMLEAQERFEQAKFKSNEEKHIDNSLGKNTAPMG